MSDLKIFSNNIPVKDKRIIVRLDLNVPINNSQIDDDTRIKVIEPFVNKLIKDKAKVILLSHLGRPKGKVVSKLSLKPIFTYLEKKLNGKIYFYQKKIDDKAVEASNKLKSGEVLLFENIRFFKEEEENDDNFAKNLAKLGDLFVNEAFSCSHRKQASIHKITQFIDSYGGPVLEKEIQSINLIMKNIKKPVTCIIGGSKVSTKINILLNLIKNADNLIIVGAMANNFIKYKNYNIGQSVYEKDAVNLIKDIMKKSEENNCKIIIPTDVIVSKNLNSKGQLKNLDEIDDSDLILDIGNKTIETIVKIIEDSKTLLWNGPAGYFEIDEFSLGSNKIAKIIAKNTKNKSLISVAGGGDTVAAINKFKCLEGFSYISTAGGAFLELLEGKILPGIKALEKNE